MLEVAAYLSGATLAILIALIWATIAKARGMEEAEMAAVVQKNILNERARHLEEAIYLAYGKLFPGCTFVGAEIALWMIADELELSRKELKVQHNFYTLTVKQRDSAREEAARLATERDAVKARAARLEEALSAIHAVSNAQTCPRELRESFGRRLDIVVGISGRALNPEGGEHDDY
jgi:hypothetical protein